MVVNARLVRSSQTLTRRLRFRASCNRLALSIENYLFPSHFTKPSQTYTCVGGRSWRRNSSKLKMT